ncbi:hypothetical protein BJY21_001857 [Kineosphaera limosa]|nr:hypothetical protein [Kineosphaera limosa]
MGLAVAQLRCPHGFRSDWGAPGPAEPWRLGCEGPAGLTGQRAVRLDNAAPHWAIARAVAQWARGCPVGLAAAQLRCPHGFRSDWGAPGPPEPWRLGCEGPAGLTGQRAVRLDNAAPHWAIARAVAQWARGCPVGLAAAQLRCPHGFRSDWGAPGPPEPWRLGCEGPAGLTGQRAVRLDNAAPHWAIARAVAQWARGCPVGLAAAQLRCPHGFRSDWGAPGPAEPWRLGCEGPAGLTGQRAVRLDNAAPHWAIARAVAQWARGCPVGLAAAQSVTQAGLRRPNGLAVAQLRCPVGISAQFGAHRPTGEASRRQG